MFTKEIAGTANALVGGWGNLGGGVTQLVMGAVLFPLFKTGMSFNFNKFISSLVALHIMS